MAIPYYANAPLPDTNARQLATTIRQPSTALLTIDSEDRYTDFIQARASPSSPYNFSIVKSESLMPGFMTRIGVSEINFPWVIPNINLKTNQIQLVYKVGAAAPVTQIISLIPGFNTPSSLATLLQEAVQLYVPTFVMTYGQGADPVFAYEAGVAGTVVGFLPMTYNSPAYPYSSQTKQLFDVLGFTTANQTPAIGGNGLFTFAQACRYVDIVCNQLTNSQAQKDQTSQTVARDMLCRIYLGDGGGSGQSTVLPGNAAFCPPGCAPTTIYRNFTMPKQIQWIPNQNIPGYLQFTVYDDTGDLLDKSLVIPGNAFSYTSQVLDWSMTMLISEC